MSKQVIEEHSQRNVEKSLEDNKGLKILRRKNGFKREIIKLKNKRES